jgi:cation diffusion facilitator CzcD-associated flavoprotein CzcO
MTEPSPTIPHVRVAVVGSGFGGLGTAVRLRQEGMEDFVVFEQADDVGGVWRDNRYPGVACDVQSHLYSFSFAPNPHWTHRFSPGGEIWEYLRRVADEFGIRSHIRFRHRVREAAWDERTARWRIDTTGGRWTAEVLVAAPGAFSAPNVPLIPGLDAFEGPVLHSARWDEAVDLAGKRVAVIGTGASAIQIVPAIQPSARRLVLFQRTPPWIVPRHDRALSGRMARALARAPLLQRAIRAGIYHSRELLGLPFRHPGLARFPVITARRHLRSQVPDPALRAKLTPDYTIGCKRILLSDDYYPALTQPNVEVVGGAAAVRPRSVVSADGSEHPADAIVLGTGFHVTDFPFAREIRGKDGRSLADAWGASPTAHLGTTVAGFPNLFVLQGPNTGLGHTSVVLMIEAQVEHVVNALRHMQAHRLAAVEPRPEAQAAFVAAVDRRMARTVWITGGCRSWYLDETGRNSTLWPGSVGAFRRRVEPFRPEEYHQRPAAEPVRPRREPAGA